MRATLITVSAAICLGLAWWGVGSLGETSGSTSHSPTSRHFARQPVSRSPHGAAFARRHQRRGSARNWRRNPGVARRSRKAVRRSARSESTGHIVQAEQHFVSAPRAPQTGATASEEQSSQEEEIEPYSQHPSELKPFFVCPAPTEGRASCTAVGAANAGKLSAAGLPQPDYEGSGKNGGFSPADLRSAYKLPEEGGNGLTVAITIAFDDPKAEEDLASYRSQYGLPPCTTANGCFSKVNQEGEEANYPEPNAEWAGETSLDLDMVSAACPECDILLVEADSNYTSDLGPAVEEAAKLEADVISDSWAGGERSGETTEDHYYHHPGIPVLFSSGDSGYGVLYPAASPEVIAVGGTSLKKSANARGWEESAWSKAGSGCSAYEEKPAWQNDEACANRTVADASAVADPYTPVSVYDSFERSGWQLVGGTSASTPLLAGVEALSSADFRALGAGAFWYAGGAQQFFDPADGSNGGCGGYLCQGEVGYDGPTGWGTPDGTPSLPTAVTGRVKVESENAATLHGSVDPKGLDTKYRFDYGETTSYGSSVPIPDESVASGSDYLEVSQPIVGLKGKTLYHYRITAVNSEGTFHGLDRTFGTTPPSVTTEAATAVHGNDATLNATVNPEGSDTRYWFEYGLTSEYGSQTPLGGENIGSNTDPATLSRAAGFLIAGRTYHFRVAAKNTAGKVYGSDETFSTAAPDWTADLPSAAEKAERLQAVSCVSQDDCIYLGNPPGYKYGLTWHWHDGEWSALPSIPEADGTVGVTQPTALSCTSMSWCVATGFYSIAHSAALQDTRPLVETWNGSDWTFAPIPTPPSTFEGSARIEDVSCASAFSCVAVGEFGETDADTPSGVGSRPLIERWDGSGWSYETPPPPSSTFRFGQFESVSCSSASYCVAVGYYGGNGLGWHGLAEVWNGERWSVSQDIQPHGFAYFTGVSCSSASNCMAVGQSEQEDEYFADHWDGSSWAIDPISVPVGTEDRFNASVACPAANYCAVSAHVIGGEPHRNRAVAFAWDGSEWTEQATDTAVVNEEYSTFSSLYNVECTSSSHCVAVGEANRHALRESYSAPGPLAKTEPASHVETEGARLNATVDPEGSETSYWFEYGTTNDYGSKAPTPAEGIGDEAEDVVVETTLKGLLPATTYHYRLVATDSAGTSYGQDRRFTTRAPAPSFVSSFGEYGSEEGAMNEPLGLAVDPEDNVWVADSENSRIEKFNSDGELLLQFGSEGAAAGQLQEPYAITIGAEGNVWVADSFNQRLDEFDPQGKFLKAIGWGVLDGKDEAESCQEICQAGIAGSGEGQVDHPYGLTAAPDGDLWVVNWHQRAEELDREGEFVGDFNSGAGSLSDIALDTEGNLWLADYTGHVREFTPTGESLLTFGSTGSGNGELDFPTGLGVDSEGNIWVADSENNRVQEFNAKGEYLTQFGEAGSGEGQMDFPRDVAFDSEGNLLVADSENSRIDRWSYGPSAITEAATAITPYKASLNAVIDTQGLETTYEFEYGETTSYGTLAPVSPLSLEPGGGSTPVTRTVKGLTPDTTYHYRIVAINPTGKTYGSDATFSTHATMPSFFFAVGSRGLEPGQFQTTEAVVTDAHGNLWATDGSLNRVEEFNAAGEYLTELGAQGEGEGEFASRLQGVAVDKSGNILVADTDGSRIEKFDPDGSYLSQFGSYGSADGRFSRPKGIAVDPTSGDIYVVDSRNNRVEVFTAAGEYEDKFGAKGSGPGQFIYPSGIAIDDSGGPSDGDIYVVDGGNNGTGNNRVQKFGSSGEYLSEIRPMGEGSFESRNESVVDIAVDGAGNLFVGDIESDRVQEFSPEGEFLGWFGGRGEGDGKFMEPGGVAADAEGNLWIADRHRVEKWSHASAPNSTAEAATLIGTTQATLNGTIDPEGSPTSYYFEYGPTTSYGSRVPAKAGWVGSGGSDVAVSKTLSGLTDGNTYHFRLVAESEVGTSYSEDRAFTTLVAVPVATTEPATGVEATQAILNGTVNPEGSSTTYRFEYGATMSYGSKAPVSPESAGSGSSGVPVSEEVGDLAPGATYHFRLSATSAGGTALGEDMQFTTATLPYAYGTAFGSSGSGEGQFSTPAGIARDAEGNLLVVDAGDNRVEEFNSKGEYLSAFGSLGSGNGQLKSPKGIAIDSAGNVWVADTSNNRVEEFNSNGEYLSQFGTLGTGNGQLNSPRGIAIDSAGDLWVTDYYNNRVEEFNAKGEYLSQFGTEGSGNGQFYYPEGIAIDPTGHVWVIDTWNARVEEFNAKGEYLSQFGSSGSGEGQLSHPGAIAIDPTGNLWVSDNNRVEEFNAKGEYLSQFGSSGSGEGQLKKTPYGLAASGAHVWVSDRNNRVQRWDRPLPPFASSFGSTGTASGQFDEPTRVAADSEGNLWVTDRRNYRVQEFGPTGGYLGQFGSQGTEEGQFSTTPRGIAIDSEDHIWVDAGGLQEFNREGKFLRQFAASPWDIAVDSTGDLWITESSCSCVKHFSPTGEYLGQFGSNGTGNGQFKAPRGIGIDSEDHIWVADGKEGRVQEFDREGKYLGQFGSHGTGEGQFGNGIEAIAFDPAGNIWVVDKANNRVEEWSRNGVYLGTFGSYGSGEGQLSSPTGIAAVGGGLWVLDAGNDRVERWSY